MQIIMDGEIVGRTGDYEFLNTMFTDGFPVNVYFNKKKDRLEQWHINQKGEYFFRMNNSLYVKVLETKDGWRIDGSERLVRSSENAWIREITESEPSE